MYQFVLGFSAGAAVASWITKSGGFRTVAHGSDSAMTPQRKEVLVHFLCQVHDPDRLMKLANMFHSSGLPKAAQELKSKANQVHQQAVVAGEWVDRARAGDQNAIASIAATRQQAEQGSARAQVSCHLIERYMDMNPPPAADVHGAFAAGEEPAPEEQPSETPDGLS